MQKCHVILDFKCKEDGSSVVGVDLLRADIAVLTGAEWVARSSSNGLTIDVAHTEPGELTSLVDDSQDSIGGSGVLDVAPRNRKVAARLVGEGLGSSVTAGHADHGAVLGLAVGDNVEVVVAPGIALTAVAVNILKRPLLAIHLLWVGTRSCCVGTRGLGCGSSRRSSGGRGRRSNQGECTANLGADSTGWVAMSRVASVAGCHGARSRSDKAQCAGS